MPIPSNKKELIDAIETTYQNLSKDLIDIPISAASKLDLDGHAKGTKMSVCNLTAYLIGWGELVLKWNDNKKNGVEVDFPETGYKWTELGLLAQKFYKDYEQYDYPNLLKKLEEVFQEILQLIIESSETELYEELWYKKYTMGRMIQLNTSSPYKNARARVRKWKKNYKL